MKKDLYKMRRTLVIRLIRRRKGNMMAELNKMDLRRVWKNEALDFTNWLAEEENLDLLSSEIGIDIGSIQTEASVGILMWIF
ncbi:MAG: hypothetical protein U9N35_06495 [Euryarchaeota archaeon]|nr:hypothetical protein [Euryarchaeota archaeon]